MKESSSDDPSHIEIWEKSRNILEALDLKCFVVFQTQKISLIGWCFWLGSNLWGIPNQRFLFLQKE